MSLSCYKCGAKLPEAYKVMMSRRDTCPSCSCDLRCCRMCQFYDEKAYNECRETSADRILDKEKANFCDYFKVGSANNEIENQRQDALARAAALFKKN